MEDAAEMSLVSIFAEDRFLDDLERLAREVGFGILAPRDAVRDLGTEVQARLEREPDLALLASESRGQGWIPELDRRGLRYWLVQVGSPQRPGMVAPARQPHRHLLGLNGSTTAYLGQLLDDWRDRPQVRVDCFTFAFRQGLPPEADWVLDTRFLDSPYWVPEMRETVGSDPAVRRYVMSQPGAKELLTQFLPMLLRLVPLYQAQRRSVLRVAVGCTGGLHRSMAIATELVERIQDSDEATARYLTEPPLHLPQELD